MVPLSSAHSRVRTSLSRAHSCEAVHILCTMCTVVYIHSSDIPIRGWSILVRFHRRICVVDPGGHPLVHSPLAGCPDFVCRASVLPAHIVHIVRIRSSLCTLCTSARKDWRESPPADSVGVSPSDLRRRFRHPLPSQHARSCVASPSRAHSCRAASSRVQAALSPSTHPLPLRIFSFFLLEMVTKLLDSLNNWHDQRL